jgi:hypothetical protein
MNDTEASRLTEPMRKIREAVNFVRSAKGFQEVVRVEVLAGDFAAAVTRNKPRKINGTASHIYVESATDPDVFVWLIFSSKNDEVQAVKLSLNSSYTIDNNMPIKNPQIYWPAQTGKALTLVCLQEGRLQTGKVVIDGGTAPSGGSSNLDAPVTLVADTAAIIVAAKNNRVSCVVQNNCADTLYVGALTADNTTSYKSYASGESFYYDGKAALYGHSVAGGVVAVLEQLR